MSLLVKNEVAGITKQAFSFHSLISCAFNSRRFLLKSVTLKSYSILINLRWQIYGHYRLKHNIIVSFKLLAQNNDYTMQNFTQVLVLLDTTQYFIYKDDFFKF